MLLEKKKKNNTRKWVRCLCNLCVINKFLVIAINFPSTNLQKKEIFRKKNYKLCKDLTKRKKRVARLGIEPRLFWTKTRRVASYTIGQKINKIIK